MNPTIKIGTRASKLALWQAFHIESLLNAGGYATEIIKIDTKGDKILDVSISKIGSKGVFTEEIEEQLAAGNIDIAVHSAKDMQSELPKGFELIAFTEREEVNDVVVSIKKDLSTKDPKKEWTLGTSSTRRIALLKHHHPHIKTVPIRGNLQTRIAKMKEGQCDGLLLAYAGVKRMGYEDMISEKLSFDTFIPAVGQGSIAIEASKKLDIRLKLAIRKLVNHPETEVILLAERAYLKELQGGCSIPVFALAKMKESLQLSITGGIISLDGKQILKENVTGEAVEAEKIGNKLAQIILDAGGDKILAEIRRNL